MVVATLSPLSVLWAMFCFTSKWNLHILRHTSGWRCMCKCFLVPIQLGRQAKSVLLLPNSLLIHIKKTYFEIIACCLLPTFLLSVVCGRESIRKASPKQSLRARYRRVSIVGSEGLERFPAVSHWEVRESKEHLLSPYPRPLLNTIMCNSIVWLFTAIFFLPANLLEQYVFPGSISAAQETSAQQP